VYRLAAGPNALAYFGGLLHGWRKVVESAPATASAGEQTYVGGLRTASKSRPATAGVVDRAPPPMVYCILNLLSGLQESLTRTYLNLKLILLLNFRCS
jgi:hypothetical protein